MDKQDILYTLQDASRHVEEAREILEAISGHIETRAARQALERAAEEIERLQ